VGRVGSGPEKVTRVHLCAENHEKRGVLS